MQNTSVFMCRTSVSIRLITDRGAHPTKNPKIKIILTFFYFHYFHYIVKINFNFSNGNKRKLR